MDIPKGFAKKSEEKLEELLLTKQDEPQDEPLIAIIERLPELTPDEQSWLLQLLQEREISTEVRKSGIEENEIEAEEWLEKVAAYITKLDTGLEIKKENWDYGWSVGITCPPKIILQRRVIETYEEKNKYFPFIKKTKQREKLNTVIYAYMKRYGIVCYDRNYEDIALKIAKKLGHEKIDSRY